MDPKARAGIARAAAAALERGPAPPALVGFDGFIDSTIDLVDRRRGVAPGGDTGGDMTGGGYTRIATIGAFAARCAAAAGRSTNIERVVKERRFGGNGPLLASALARLGAPVTFIGAVADEGPADTPALHPV